MSQGPVTSPKSEETPKSDKPQIPKGGRNLVLLGVFAVVITFTTTFIALKLYHDSDIYLDRSRPGFLPEKEEVETNETPADYAFPDSGKLTPEVLDEYLEHLKEEIDRVNDFSSDPFGVTPLSDSTIGF